MVYVVGAINDSVDLVMFPLSEHAGVDVAMLVI